MSAVPPSEPWESVAFIPPSRLTRMTHVALPGTVAGNAVNKSIATINPVYPTMIVTCTASGGGFTKDQTYIRNADNTAWRGISGGTHLHNDTTETAGGLLSNILIANQTKVLAITDTINPSLSLFPTREGTATVTDESANATGARIKIDTGATSGNYGHLSRGGVKLSFGAQSQFMWKGNVDYSGSGNVTAYIGVGVASVNETHNSIQYGIQVCDSAGIERQWEMVNGNGTTKGIQTTTENVKQTSPRGYRLVYNPGASSQLWIGAGLSTTNTNALVASGASTGIRNISFGIRTNTTVTRTMYCHGTSLVGTVSDSNWL